MPENEMMAHIRRVRLKTVAPLLDKNFNRYDILRKLSKVDSVKNDVEGALQPITEHDSPARVKKHPERSVKNDVSSSPINNWPAYDPAEGGLPDAVTLEVFSLRRRQAELTAKLAAANDKLTDALECLFSQRRFLQLWVTENQGESFDKLHARIKRIQATIDKIENRNIGPSPELELPERWKSKT